MQRSTASYRPLTTELTALAPAVGKSASGCSVQSEDDV